METQVEQKKPKADLNLEEVLPGKTEIELQVGDESKKFELRSVNLLDFRWIQSISKSGADIDKGMKDVGLVSKFLYRLIKDKGQLPPIKRKDYDDDGNEVEVSLTGPDRVLEGMTVEFMGKNMKVMNNLFADAMPLLEQANKPLVQDYKKKQ